jgi:hypothetical protein
MSENENKPMGFWKTVGAVFLGNKLAQPSTQSEKDRALRVFGFDKLINNLFVDVCNKQDKEHTLKYRVTNGKDKYGIDERQRKTVTKWGIIHLTKNIDKTPERNTIEFKKKLIEDFKIKFGIDLNEEIKNPSVVLEKVDFGIIERYPDDSWRSVEFVYQDSDLFSDRAIEKNKYDCYM